MRHTVYCTVISKATQLKKLTFSEKAENIFKHKNKLFFYLKNGSVNKKTFLYLESKMAYIF